MVKSSSGTDKVVVDDDGTMSITDVSLAEHATEADKVLHSLTVGNTTLNSKAVSFDGSQTKSVDLQSLATYTSGISDFDDIKDSKIIGINGASGYANSPKSQVSYYDTINWGTLLSVKGSHHDGYDTMQFLVGNLPSQNLYFRTGFPDYAPNPIFRPWCNIITDLNSAINPNIAINYDFRNPVNQRGQTSYTETGYCIDDWYLREGSTQTVTLTENGLHIVSSGDSTGKYWALNQRIEFPKTIVGKTVTFSMYISQNNNTSTGPYNSLRCGVVGGNSITYNTGQFIRIYIPVGYTGLLTATAKVPDNILSNYSGINIELYHNESATAGTSIDMTISAVKLELGPRQTLARRNSSGQWEICDVPDYSEQFLKCARYLQIFGNIPAYNDMGFIMSVNNGKGAVMQFPSYCPMRTNPVATIPNSLRCHLMNQNISIIDSTTFNIQYTEGLQNVLSVGSSGLPSGTTLPTGLSMWYGNVDNGSGINNVIIFNAQL